MNHISFASAFVFSFLALVGIGCSQFDSVIDVPPKMLGDGMTIESNTQLNVFDGGVVGAFLQAGSPVGDSVNVEVNVFGGDIGVAAHANAGSTFNVFGGTLQNFFEAKNGSLVNVSDGNVGGFFTIESGSTVNVSGGRFGVDPFINALVFVRSGSQFNITGGVFGDRLNVDPGASVSISGNEFEVNGLPVTSNFPITLNPKDVFTAVLSDGKPFFASVQDDDQLIDVQLIETEIPPTKFDQIIVDEFGDKVPDGLRTGQTLTLLGDGEIRENFTAIGATINIEGGVFGQNLDVVNSTLTQTGGLISSFSGAFGESEINLNAGTLRGLVAGNGVTVNLNGTTLTGRLDAECGSTVNVTAGTGGAIDAKSGSAVEISGGVFGADFESGSTGLIYGGRLRIGFSAAEGSDVVLRGGEFLVNNIRPKNTTNVSLGPDDVLTATLEDGNVVAFSESLFDEVDSIRLESTTIPGNKGEEFVLDEVDDVSPTGLRAGQRLIVKDEGAVADDFTAVDAIVDVTGGEVGNNFEAAFCDVTITGGRIGGPITALRGTCMSIRGGEFFTVVGGSGSEIDICGGDFEINGSSLILINTGANAKISGGEFGAGVNLEPNAFLELSGPQFFLDGEPIDDLQPGVPTLITQRGVNLSGLFRDGSKFSFELNPEVGDFFSGDYFDPEGQLVVTLQDLLVVGDLNGDGVVDLLDVSPFVTQIVSGIFLAEADINKDGAVNLLDVEPFIDLLLR